MKCDARGGHNYKKFNKNFFKIWSPKMAYVLGYIFADGAILDSRKSSRTCYLSITSVDKEILLQIKKALHSKHNIYTRLPSKIIIRGKTYLRAKSFDFRIGSKEVFQDLINLGVVPRKSLRLKFPHIPKGLFNFFLRGYFDGDGCINIYFKSNTKTPTLQTIFVSGCKNFLVNLAYYLNVLINTKHLTVIKNGYAYRLIYKKSDSLKIASLMYNKLGLAPYLKRKYKKYVVFNEIVLKNDNNMEENRVLNFS